MADRQTACPGCGAGVKLSSELAPGQRVRCPKCKTGFPIPDEEEEAAVAQRPRRGEERDQTPRPTRRPRRDDDDDDDDRPRRPRRKKKSSKAGLVIVLSLVGVLVIAGVFVVLIGVNQGWFSSGDGGSSTTSSDKSKPPDRDKAGGPDRPDKGGGPILPPPATGQVRVIPTDILDQLNRKGGDTNEGAHLRKIEQLLGAPGKRLDAAELNEASQAPGVQAIRNNAPNAYAYRWTSATQTLYVFFEGGQWRGEALVPKRPR
jgi:hypothetical protein